MTSFSRNRKQSAFTIVELLIVIVVIGILALITIVAYNGIQQRARASAASNALAQAKKQLSLYQVDNGSYPATGNLPSAGVIDGDSSFQYTSNGTTYCITATNGTVSYKATESTAPTTGGCAGHGQGGVAAVMNFTPNPSFEVNSVNWSWANGDGYTGGVSSTVAYSGINSFVINASASVVDRYLETYVSVSAGTYTFSAYIYLTGAGATISDRQVWFHCATGSCTTAAEPTYNKSLLNQWQRVQKTITATAPASLRIRFYAPVSSLTYIDGVSVTGGSILSGYGDGSSPNWIWNGTAHNSTSTGPAL